jgi:hypothetical protein
MKNFKTNVTRLKRPAWNRSGVTITEVLMSLAIMGIGIVVVASLFPAAVLRTIHATQLTNGTILRYNAEVAIDLRSMARFRAGSTVAPRVYLVDPLGWNIRTLDSLPTPLTGATTLTRFNDRISDPDPKDVILDAGVTAAARIVTLPDSWVEQARGDVEANTVTRNSGAGTASITLPSSIDISNLDTTFSASTAARVVLFNSNGRGSVTLDAASRSGQTLVFTTESAKHLNAIMKANDFSPGGLAIVQAQERRYTWMLTVRQDTGQIDASTENITGASPNYDIVVFFNRSFHPDDEKTYTAARTAASRAAVSFTAGSPPHYERGGFVFLFGGNTGEWYRVQKVVSEAGNNAVLQLDRDPPATINSAVIMRGVVEVFKDLNSFN